MNRPGPPPAAPPATASSATGAPATAPSATGASATATPNRNAPRPQRRSSASAARAIGRLVSSPTHPGHPTITDGGSLYEIHLAGKVPAPVVTALSVVLGDEGVGLPIVETWITKHATDAAHLRGRLERLLETGFEIIDVRPADEWDPGDGAAMTGSWDGEWHATNGGYVIRATRPASVPGPVESVLVVSVRAPRQLAPVLGTLWDHGLAVTSMRRLHVLDGQALGPREVRHRRRRR